MYKKFKAWSAKGKLDKIFKALLIEPDLEGSFIDGSDTKACQHSAGAAGDKNEAIGKSRGGHTAKVHLAVDAYGGPMDFDRTGEEVNDCKAAPELIAKLPQTEVIIADRGYDNEPIREQISAKEKK